MKQLTNFLQVLHLKIVLELASLVRAPLSCALCRKAMKENHELLLQGQGPGFRSWPLRRLCPDCLNALKAPQVGAIKLEDFPPLANKSFGIYAGPLRTLIHIFKYHNQRELAYDLALLLADLLQKEESLKSKALLIPVPLHESKLKERGFNQASELARLVAIICGLDFSPKALIRVQKTRSQYGLNKKERLKNVQAAFLADGRKVRGRKIILVDDIVTTGATACACREALEKEGAREIKLLTLAQALLRHSS